MLKIVRDPQFTTLVTVSTLALSGAFNVTFVAKPSSELKALEKAAQGDGLSVQQSVLRAVVKSHDPVDLYGTTHAYTGPESLDALLDVPGLGPAMLKRYYEALWEEAQGNSAASPAGS